MRYTVRPISDRTAFTGNPARSPFRANWSQTLHLLGDELAQLAAENVVLELDVTEGEIRRDGMVRANAKIATPGVRIAFDSLHGPLTYATDAFYSPWSGEPDWQHNVRAVALSLEALRKVDRYGVTKRGEQYAGWKALPSGAREAGPAAMSRSEAEAVITAVVGVMDRPWDTRVKLARRYAHPDLNQGDHTLAYEVDRAAQVLGLAR